MPAPVPDLRHRIDGPEERFRAIVRRHASEEVAAEVESRPIAVRHAALTACDEPWITELLDEMPALAMISIPRWLNPKGRLTGEQVAAEVADIALHDLVPMAGKRSARPGAGAQKR